jgi:anti-anti-sigma factor
VNGLDFNALASNFGASGRFWSQGDFNYDLTINTLDFNALADSFGNTLPMPAAQMGALVPEPGTLTLAAATLALSRRRRSRVAFRRSPDTVSSRGGMAIEKWSEQVYVARLLDDPQFTDDLQLLSEQMSRSGTAAVLDFSTVKYVNSSNIARLLRLRKQAVTSDLKLVLCGLSTNLWGTFLSTGLDKVFEFSDNVTTALATLQISQ